MNNAFLTAAASYYGLSPDIADASDWSVEGGQPVATFRVVITEDDMIGILSRMKAMREEEAQRQREQPQQIVFANEDIRKHYDKMTPEERSKYGSFGTFKSAVLQGVAPVTSNADDFGGLPG